MRIILIWCNLTSQQLRSASCGDFCFLDKQVQRPTSKNPLGDSERVRQCSCVAGRTVKGASYQQLPPFQPHTCRMHTFQPRPGAALLHILAVLTAVAVHGMQQNGTGKGSVSSHRSSGTGGSGGREQSPPLPPLPAQQQLQQQQYSCAQLNCQAKANCMCASTVAPGGPAPSDVPQFILLTCGGDAGCQGAAAR